MKYFIILSLAILSGTFCTSNLFANDQIRQNTVANESLNDNYFDYASVIYSGDSTISLHIDPRTQDNNSSKNHRLLIQFTSIDGELIEKKEILLDSKEYINDQMKFQVPFGAKKVFVSITHKWVNPKMAFEEGGAAVYTLPRLKQYNLDLKYESERNWFKSTHQLEEGF